MTELVENIDEAGRNGSRKACTVVGALHNPIKRLHKSPCSPSAAKFLPLRGADCSALRRTIFFIGGRRAEKGCS